MIKYALKALITLQVLTPIISFSQNIKSFSKQPGPEEGKDAWVWSGDRTKDGNFGVEQPYNRGLNNVIRAEVWKWFGQEESDTLRSFIHFDMSEIPKNATVLEAKLSLYYFSNPGFTPQIGANELEIVLVKESWKENLINWVNQSTEPIILGMS